MNGSTVASMQDYREIIPGVLIHKDDANPGETLNRLFPREQFAALHVKYAGAFSARGELWAS